jgi:hypothetical protein
MRARGAMKMVKTFTQENVFKRILWLYGLRTLISNISLLAGYHLLPEGIFRGASPFAALVARQSNFWLHFGETIIINFSFIAFGVGMSLFMYREGIPFGYGIPIATGIFGGLILGSNSFMDDLSRYSVLEGLVRGYSIGELEVLAYIFIIASTAGISIYMDTTPWYSLKTKMVKVKNFRDIRLSRQEWIVLLIGIFLLIIAGYNETMLWFTEVIG